MAPDRELQAAIMAAGEIKTESRELRLAIKEFAELLRKGLIRSTIQGLAMIVVGIMLAITFLGLLSQTWSCDAGNLAGQKGSLRYKACAVIFPQIIPQVSGIQKAAAAAKAADENRQAVLDERRKTNEYLDKNPARVGCILKIPPEKRNDQNVNDCLTGATK